MIRFFLHDVEVPWERASKAWFRSRTYERANRKTRDEIWRDAMAGSEDRAVHAHLAEAGIRIVIDVDVAREAGNGAR